MDNMETKENLNTKNEIEGKITFDLVSEKSLEEFCEKYFNNYNSRDYEALALRVHYGKEINVTLFALVKQRMKGETFGEGKVPVKKFKQTNFSWQEVISFITGFNFTITTGKHSLDEMQVINK